LFSGVRLIPGSSGQSVGDAVRSGEGKGERRATAAVPWTRGSGVDPSFLGTEQSGWSPVGMGVRI